MQHMSVNIRLVKKDHSENIETRSFPPTLWFGSRADESFVLYVFILIFLHSADVSADVSQVGVTLFSPF